MASGDARTTQTFVEALLDNVAARTTQTFLEILVQPFVPPSVPMPEAVAFPDLPGIRGAPEMALARREGAGGLPYGSFRVESLGGGVHRLYVNIGRDPSGLACEIGGASCLRSDHGRLVLRGLTVRYAGVNLAGVYDAHEVLSELGGVGFDGDSARAFHSVARWNADANARGADLFDCHLYGTRGDNALASEGSSMNLTRCSLWNAGGFGVFGTMPTDPDLGPTTLRMRSSRIWGCEGGTLVYDLAGMRGEASNNTLTEAPSIAEGVPETYVVAYGNTVRATGLFAPPPAPAWAPYP